MGKESFYKKCIAIILVGVMALAIAGCGAVITKDEGTISSEQTTPASNQADVENTNQGNENHVEKEIRAQDDFYGYVNKDTLLGYTLDYRDSGAGYMYEIQDEIDKEIYTMIESILNSKEIYEKGSNEWVVRETYYQIKEYLKDKKSNAKSDYIEFVKQVNEIDNLDQAFAMFRELKEHYGVFDIIPFDVEEDYRNSEKYAIYVWQNTSYQDYDLKSIYENNSTRKQVKNYVVDMLVMSGKSVEEAEVSAEDFLYYIADVACETDYSLQESAGFYDDLKCMTDEELDCLLENISMAQFEKGLNLNNPDKVWYIQDEIQFAATMNMFDEENIELLKTFLICSYTYEFNTFLIDDYPVLNAYTSGFDEKDTTLVNELMVRTLGTQISELYAKYYFTEEMETQLLRMKQDITVGYEQLICEADWISEEGKKGLLDKLHNMRFIYGGGESQIQKKDNIAILGSNYYETYINSKALSISDFEKKIGTKPDPKVTGMTSNTLNAMYTPSNKITITVGIMHAPYFDVNASYEENLGGLGMVIGHEMGHAFDSNCMKFDANGNYNEEWLSEEDRVALAKRLTQMEDYYSSFTIMDVYHVDGEQTAGENYADIGSMECLMKIVTDKKGQGILFENYARIWCNYQEDTDAIYNLSHDEHSPNVIRVNAVLSTIPEFYEVYDVQPGDSMYVEPERRVSRW